MSRSIKIVSTEGGNRTISTNATTWGELKTKLSEEGYNMDVMRATAKETRHTYESNDAVLDSNVSTLYLTPQKTKSGQTDVEFLEDMASMLESVESEVSDMRESLRKKIISVSAGSDVSDEDAEILQELIEQYAN